MAATSEAAAAIAPHAGVSRLASHAFFAASSPDDTSAAADTAAILVVAADAIRPCGRIELREPRLLGGLLGGILGGLGRGNAGAGRHDRAHSLVTKELGFYYKRQLKQYNLLTRHTGSTYTLPPASARLDLLYAADGWLHVGRPQHTLETWKGRS
jgi:hypothetical protein